VALTPAGAALLPEVQRILQQAAALPDLARRAASGASGLSLSFISSADYSILPRCCNASAPAIRRCRSSCAKPPPTSSWKT
jgi:DNA-binding transcriptional LysR family regulator